MGQGSGEAFGEMGGGEWGRGQSEWVGDLREGRAGQCKAVGML